MTITTVHDAPPAGLGQEVDEMSDAVLFRHEKGEIGDKRKVIALHCKTDRAYCVSQTLNKSGGETNLHSHTHLDGFWFVIEGRVRFYTTGDEVIAELGKHEGVLIPRGYPYWFESVGDQELELLQLHASDRPIAKLEQSEDDPDDPLHRVNYTERVWELGKDVVATTD